METEIHKYAYPLKLEGERLCYVKPSYIKGSSEAAPQYLDKLDEHASQLDETANRTEVPPQLFIHKFN